MTSIRDFYPFERFSQFVHSDIDRYVPGCTTDGDTLLQKEVETHFNPALARFLDALKADGTIGPIDRSAGYAWDFMEAWNEYVGGPSLLEEDEALRDRIITEFKGFELLNNAIAMACRDLEEDGRISDIDLGVRFDEAMDLFDKGRQIILTHMERPHTVCANTGEYLQVSMMDWKMTLHTMQGVDFRPAPILDDTHTPKPH